MEADDGEEVVAGAGDAEEEDGVEEVEVGKGLVEAPSRRCSHTFFTGTVEAVVCSLSAVSTIGLLFPWWSHSCKSFK